MFKSNDFLAIINNKLFHVNYIMIIVNFQQIFLLFNWRIRLIYSIILVICIQHSIISIMFKKKGYNFSKDEYDHRYLHFKEFKIFILVISDISRVFFIIIKINQQIILLLY